MSSEANEINPVLFAIDGLQTPDMKRHAKRAKAHTNTNYQTTST